MKKSSMKFGLIGIIAAFAIIPVLVLGIVGTISILNYSGNVRTGELKDVSLSKAGVINTLFESYQKDASALSKMKDVVDSAKNNNDNAQNTLKAISENNKDIYDALIISNEGNVFASALGIQKNFEHFNSGVSGMPAISDIVNWQSYGFSSFFVSHEIYENPDSNDKPLGYVCLVIDPAEGTALSNAVAGKFLEDNAYIALIDSKGSMYNFECGGTFRMSTEISENSSFKSLDAHFKPADLKSYSEVYKNVVTAKSGGYTYAAGSFVDVVGWTWVGMVNTKYISGFTTTTMLIAWGVVLVSAVIAALIGMAMVNKYVNKMHNMIQKMDSIDANDDGVITSVRFDSANDKSELGNIQNLFNEFLDEVNLSSQRYRTLANLSDNMLFEWDFHKEQMYVSDNTLAKFDINTHDSTISNGKFIDALMSTEDADRYKRDINSLIKNKGQYTAEYQLRTKSGTTIWVSVSATCIVDRVDEPLRIIGVLTDIDNEKKLELQLSERASYDFLSQLYNRSTFIRMLTTELDRRGPNKIGVMFIDVDDFKFINDRYGHTVGDEVIRYVADTIRTKVDDRGGFAGRFGGDEFVLCFTNQGDIANAEQIAMDIIDELYVGYTTTDGMLINVRASIGISYCPQHTEDVNELLSFSDTAMYFVKKNGKTNYHVYVPEDSESGEYIDPEGY